MKPLLTKKTTVSRLTSFWYPFDMFEYHLWAYGQGLDPLEITEKARQGGYDIETYAQSGFCPAFNQFLKDERLNRKDLKWQENVILPIGEDRDIHGRLDFETDEIVWDIKSWGYSRDKDLKRPTTTKMVPAFFQTFCYAKMRGKRFAILHLYPDGYLIYRPTQKQIETFEEMLAVSIQLISLIPDYE